LNTPVSLRREILEEEQTDANECYIEIEKEAKGEIDYLMKCLSVPHRIFVRTSSEMERSDTRIDLTSFDLDVVVNPYCQIGYQNAQFPLIVETSETGY
jgi:hypothetical protein